MTISEYALTGVIGLFLLGGAYMMAMYLGAVYHIKKEIKRKDLEDEQIS